MEILPDLTFTPPSPPKLSWCNMTYMTERKKVRQKKDIRNFFDWKTVAEAHEFLSELLVDYPKDIIDVGTKDDYGSQSAYIHLLHEDWETEQQYNERKRSETEQREWERKNYERLKKKFEGS